MNHQPHGENSTVIQAKGHDMKRTQRQARRERLAKLSLDELWDYWSKDDPEAVMWPYPWDLIPILEAALGDDVLDLTERFPTKDAWEYVEQLFEDLRDIPAREWFRPRVEIITWPKTHWPNRNPAR